MQSVGLTDPDHPRPTVFLSYASEDRAAARSIGDALPAFGLDVWYDESELGGGEAWDQKIRRQIRECDYFMALVSAQTEARHEGYFRREWRLAVERSLDMADDRVFLLPIVIDDTDQATARVPEKFLSVQWLKLPAGQSTPALQALCRRIASGVAEPPQPGKAASSRPSAAGTSAHTRRYPEFPREEPGQRIRFWVHVIGWAFGSAWVFFKRLPMWVRIAVYVWLAVTLLSRGCTPRHHDSAQISPADLQKLKTISNQYRGSSSKSDVAKLGLQIAREFSPDTGEGMAARSPLLAVPFTAAAGDAAAQKLADSTFALVYGTIAISRRGQVGLYKEALPTFDLQAVLERGRASQSTYVVFGAIDGQASSHVLTVKIARVADGDLLWSKSYPEEGADPAKIAAEVTANVPSLDGD